MFESRTANEAKRHSQARRRVLVVDDIADVRRDLRLLLEITGEFDVAGEAADGRNAVEQVRLLGPDIVLMDLEMPGMDGFQAATQIKSGLAQCRLVALTVYADDATRREALLSGFDSFVVKGAPITELLAAMGSHGDTGSSLNGGRS